MPSPTPDARVEALSAQCAAGGPLSREEAIALCSGDPLTLGGIANDIRRRHHGDRVTLVRVRPLAWDAAPAADAEPADEVRLAGPSPDGATPADLRSTFDRIAAAFPGIAVRALRPAEAVALARASGLTPRLLLGRLADAGLATLVHPAADDDPAATREGLLAAHGSGLATDAPIPYRSRSSAAHLAEVLLALRDLPAAAGRFRCAVPLPDSRPDQSPLSGTTGLEDLRVFACARILLPPAIRVAVEVDFLGPKLGAVALSFGADTLTGVLAVPTARLTPTDAEAPRPFNADRARLLLAEAGREPVPPPPFPSRDA